MFWFLIGTLLAMFAALAVGSKNYSIAVYCALMAIGFFNKRESEK